MTLTNKPNGPTESPTDGRLPSLMDDIATPDAPAKNGAPKPTLYQQLTDTPAKAKRFKTVLGSVGGLALGAAVVFGVLQIIPTPKPDYETGAIDDVLGYTLLTADFNQLPLEERVQLVGQVVKRFESMDAQEGTLMAAFAAGIMGEAREQLEENAATMVIDMWDEFAPGYQNITDPAEQEAYLEQATVDMIRLFERLDGDDSDKSDAEILADAREQARRDQERFRDPLRGPSAGGAARFMGFMDRELGDRASPHQRARITKLARDMTRFLRDTGG